MTMTMTMIDNDNDNDNDFIASKHIHSEWLWQTCNGIHHYQVNVIKHIKNTYMYIEKLWPDLNRSIRFIHVYSKTWA